MLWYWYYNRLTAKGTIGPSYVAVTRFLVRLAPFYPSAQKEDETLIIDLNHEIKNFLQKIF